MRQTSELGEKLSPCNQREANMIQVFHTFREASEFAANHCRANRCTAKLYRQDDDWAVKVDTPSRVSHDMRQVTK